MTDHQTDISKEDLRLLMEGKLPWPDIERAIKVTTKSEGRFKIYLELLQEKTRFRERILLRISEDLYIVAKDGGRIVKCTCGYEYGDYRVNWKLGCLIYVRRSKKEFAEVYPLPAELMPMDPEVVEIREYYCPQCQVRHGVEKAPPGYPPIFDVLPDLDTFYRDWIGEPLPDESPDWFQDKTYAKTADWAGK